MNVQDSQAVALQTVMDLRSQVTSSTSACSAVGNPIEVNMSAPCEIYTYTHTHTYTRNAHALYANGKQASLWKYTRSAHSHTHTNTSVNGAADGDVFVQPIHF